MVLNLLCGIFCFLVMSLYLCLRQKSAGLGIHYGSSVVSKVCIIKSGLRLAYGLGLELGLCVK
jgi:hypothetical protein